MPPTVAAHYDTMANQFEEQNIAEVSEEDDRQVVADVKKEATAKGEEQPEQRTSGSKEPAKSYILKRKR